MWMKASIPGEVKNILNILEKAGFQAYLVGGCVRDLILSEIEGLSITPKDWDITTDATPSEIQKLFPESVYENQFGTVAVKTDAGDHTLKIIEVTTFRLEGKYTDKRHPDEVKFAKTVEEDLSRRDFTVNALALSVAEGIADKIIDPFGGQKDLKNKLIRTVGEPAKRFEEDALRLMRAVRFSAQLNFKIDEAAQEVIKDKVGLIEFIAKERIRDEFEKLLMTDNAVRGIADLQKLGLLKYLIPELEEGVGVEQNKHHIYTVFEHNLKSLEYAVKKGFSLELRLASLLHDVGKPRSRAWKNDIRGEKTFRGKKGDWTFYQHQYIGEKLSLDILDRFRFSKKTIEQVALLVREHMFVYDPEMVTDKGVRRLIRRVGADNIDNLMLLREADRIGSGVPKAQPYRLRHLKAMIEKVKKDPVSVKMLKINGSDVMNLGELEPGPRVGYILSVLLDEVLTNPELNDKKTLSNRIKELNKLSDAELKKLSDKAKQTAQDVQKRIDENIKKKYFVK